jgi:hypothetical protein
MTGGSPHPNKVNRASVLTLWAAVVGGASRFHARRSADPRAGGRRAQRLFQGGSLGLIHPAPATVREQRKRFRGASPAEASRVADGLARATPFSDDGRPNSAGAGPAGSASMAAGSPKQVFTTARLRTHRSPASNHSACLVAGHDSNRSDLNQPPSEPRRSACAGLESRLIRRASSLSTAATVPSESGA